MLTPVSLLFQTCSPSSSPPVSGPSFPLWLWRGSPGEGRCRRPPDGAWPGSPWQSQPRPLAPTWRSSSSPSSGACAFATSVRAARQAVSQARGARIPPRPTPPSRSAGAAWGRVGSSELHPSLQAHVQPVSGSWVWNSGASRVLSVLWTDQWLHRARDSSHLPGHQGPPSPASPP